MGQPDGGTGFAGDGFASGVPGVALGVLPPLPPEPEPVPLPLPVVVPVLFPEPFPVVLPMPGRVPPALPEGRSLRSVGTWPVPSGIRWAPSRL